MAGSLEGRKVAMLATHGVEEVELTTPKAALERAGAEVHVIAPEAGTIQAMRHLDKAGQIPVTRPLNRISVFDYAGLVLPGGVANPDALRMVPEAVKLVYQFFEADKPVAAICHAPWLLVEADVVRGRTLTSWPSLRRDIENAGGSWVDRAVQVEHKLVTSRKPDDLPMFCDRMVQLFSRVAVDRTLDELGEESFPASDPPPGPAAPGGGAPAEAR